MTAKTKAIELVDKYYLQSDLLYEWLSFIQAKECALIAVDMMIEYLQHKWDTVGFAEYIIDMNKYIEIKQEIEKL